MCFEIAERWFRKKCVFAGKDEKIMGAYENAKLETRKKIIRSFWELYQTKNIEKITVKDITDASGIYRTTFYLHFSDIYAILEILEEHFLEELRRVGNGSCADARERQQYLIRLTKMLRENSEYLHILVNEQKNPSFAQRYKAEMVKRICASYEIDVASLDERLQIVIQRTISGIANLFFEWVTMKLFTFEELLAILDGYMRDGILHTFSIQIARAGN